MNDSDVDFVLVAQKNYYQNESFERQQYENKLIKDGLELEVSDWKNFKITKIKVSYKALCRYSETMKIQMPLLNDKFVMPIKEKNSIVKRMMEMPHFTSCYDRFAKYLTSDNIKSPRLSTEFRCDREHLFADVNAGENVVFPKATRIMIAHFILERTSIDKKQGSIMGIDSMLEQGIYLAAYPLHENENEDGLRKELNNKWAKLSFFLKYQPFDTIKAYFGDKVALYFSWLGFYTNMLIYASVAGIFVFIYGLITMPWNRLSNDICNANTTVMCPLCNRCKYWMLNESCSEAKFTYLFDNNLTIAFSIFMSIWSTIYLKFWKRYASIKVYEWGLIDVDYRTENPRPQYLGKLSNFNKETPNDSQKNEELPFWSVRLPYKILSYSMVMIMIMIVIIAVFGIILYRMSQKTILIFNSGTYNITVPLSAGFLNLIIITLLNMVYGKIAYFLTNMESLRTQSEFDSSLSIKTYLFQIVNYYSSIFYVAFLKGKFVGYPKEYITVLGFRQEECSSGGCFYELVIQLAIIMIGKQFITTIIEYLTPIFKKKCKKIRTLMTSSNNEPLDIENADHTPTIEKAENKQINEETDQNKETEVIPQWREDYDMETWSSIGLLDEYLEMVLQFGFVTLFVSAFPLAPLFALINNCFEVRLDAKKILNHLQRPVPGRARNIGIWFGIMDIIGRVSVVTNAFMIAFTSNFVPRMVYLVLLNSKLSTEGFLDHSLAHFNVSDFPPNQIPVDPNHPNIQICRYNGYRNPPGEAQYERPPDFWYILMGRILFIVIYQNFVNAIKVFVEWMIPDVPKELNQRIKNEACFINDQMLEVVKESQDSDKNE